jgi:hypothetical protein
MAKVRPDCWSPYDHEYMFRASTVRKMLEAERERCAVVCGLFAETASARTLHEQEMLREAASRLRALPDDLEVE